MSDGSLSDNGWAALRAGDVAAARRAFHADVETAESSVALEGLAQSLYLDGEFAAAVGRYERAFAAYRREGDAAAAGRAARTLGWITGNVLGNWAVQRGWLSRASGLLQDAGADHPEAGWLPIIRSWAEPDAQIRERVLREAIAIGRRLDNPDVEFAALSLLGGVLVLTDRVADGMACFDEAMTAACAGELTDLITVESVFCAFFWACELINDVPRTDQWMRAAAEFMRRRTVVAAFCRAHYGGILTAAGRWTEAETELVDANRHIDKGMPVRRAAALIRLAELRVRQGRLDEAGQLLCGLEHRPDAIRTVAGLYLARGDTALARDVLERATERLDDEVPSVGQPTLVGPLLALLVDVLIEEDDLDGAGRVAGRLDRLAQRQRGPYLLAAAALATGRVRVATGEGDARVCLSTALGGFTRAQLPFEQARTRLELASALADRSPRVAVAEAKAALAEFERLEAARHADAAAALLRSLGAPVRTGPKGLGALTKREAEVLALIGAGMSNPQIGDRLYISRKTVEHHVANVLTKLGLRNRAEAVAYAVRQKPAEK